MEKHMESELGTYDCIVKPFSMKELLSRIKASTWHIEVTEPIRRGTSDYKMYGRLIFDFTQAAVAKDGLVLDLSPKEYELLCCLANEPGRVYTREELLGQVWNYTGFLGDVRGVDVAIRRLREKIEDDPANPAFIKTKRGIFVFSYTHTLKWSVWGRKRPLTFHRETGVPTVFPYLVPIVNSFYHCEVFQMI